MFTERHLIPALVASVAREHDVTIPFLGRHTTRRRCWSVDQMVDGRQLGEIGPTVEDHLALTPMAPRRQPEQPEPSLRVLAHSLADGMERQAA